MKLEKSPEPIGAAKDRLNREIERIQSLDTMLTHTKELLRLAVAYPPDNPEFHWRLKAMQDKHHQPILHKMLLDVVTEN